MVENFLKENTPRKTTKFFLKSHKCIAITWYKKKANNLLATTMFSGKSVLFTDFKGFYAFQFPNATAKIIYSLEAEWLSIAST